MRGEPQQLQGKVHLEQIRGIQTPPLPAHPASASITYNSNGLPFNSQRPSAHSACRPGLSHPCTITLSEPRTPEAKNQVSFIRKGSPESHWELRSQGLLPWKLSLHLAPSSKGPLRAERDAEVDPVLNPKALATNLTKASLQILWG